MPELKDLKKISGKAQVSQRPLVPALWAARVYAYGASKYARGNYLRRPVQGPPDAGNADVERASAYIDAAMRHLYAQADRLERFYGGVALPQQAEGSRMVAIDEESGLPHLAHALVSIEMLIAQMADAGLAPRDPGEHLFVSPEAGSDSVDKLLRADTLRIKAGS